MLAHDHCQVQDKKYDGVHFLPILKAIVERLQEEQKQYGIPRADKNWNTVEVRFCPIPCGVY